jgi:Tfp pilus assembly protein PilO
MDKLKQWVALTVVACLGIMAAGWFLLVSPKRAEAADLREQAAAQETANATLRTSLKVLQAQAKDLPKKQADLARVAAKIPSDPAMPALIRALTAASTSAGVELVSVTPEPPAVLAAPVAAAPVTPAGAAPAPAPAPAPGAPVDPAAPAAGAPVAGPAGTLAAIPLTISVVGGYFEVAQFLANVENLPRALRVTDLKLVPGVGPVPSGGTSNKVEDGRSLQSTITGSVFMAADRPVATAVVAPDAAAPAK